MTISTPPATSKDLQQQFLERVSLRLDAGREEYGDGSLDRPLDVTSGEILEEIEDIAGWAFCAWVRAKRRLDDLAARVERS